MVLGFFHKLVEIVRLSARPCLLSLIAVGGFLILIVLN